MVDQEKDKIVNYTFKKVKMRWVHKFNMIQTNKILLMMKIKKCNWLIKLQLILKKIEKLMD